MIVDYSQYNPQAYTPVDGGAHIRPHGLNYPGYAQRLNTPALQIPALAQPLELRHPVANDVPQRAPTNYTRASKAPQPQTVAYGRYYSQAAAPTAAQGAFGVLAGGVSDKRAGGSGAMNATIPDAAGQMDAIQSTITAGRGFVLGFYGRR